MRLEKYRNKKPTRPLGNYVVLKDLRCGSTLLTEQMYLLIKNNMEKMSITPGDIVAFSGMVDKNKSGTKMIIRDVKNFEVKNHIPLKEYLSDLDNITFTIKEARFIYLDPQGEPIFWTQPNNQIVGTQTIALNAQLTIRLSVIYGKGIELGFDAYNPLTEVWEEEVLFFNPATSGQRLFNKKGSCILLPVELFYRFCDICYKAELCKFDEPRPYYLHPIDPASANYNPITDVAGDEEDIHRLIDVRRAICRNMDTYITSSIAAKILKEMPELDSCKNYVPGTSSELYKLKAHVVEEFDTLDDIRKSKLLTVIMN